MQTAVTHPRERGHERAHTRLRLTAGHAALTAGRDAVRDALRLAGWGAEGVELAVLAVDEALANAIEHGSLPGAPVEVRIAVAPDGATAEVRVTDRGRPGARPPRGIPPPPPPTSDHGRGLIIMGALADELEIRRAGRGTRLRLRFARPAAGDAGHRP
jgi:anti-sigma regulatory factor (Ser/Thr protein kinase)